MTAAGPAAVDEGPEWAPPFRDRSAVRHWTYLFDNIPEAFGGGFTVGELVLLRDGHPFKRNVHDSHMKQPGGGYVTMKEASQWLLAEGMP